MQLLGLVKVWIIISLAQSAVQCGHHIQGDLHLPQNITNIQAIVNASSALIYWTSLYWFKLAGPYIDFIGTSNVTTG